MAARTDTLLRHIRQLLVRPGQDGISDAALLTRFISTKDENAFAALVDRHGPLVLQVCRRIVGNVQDAEDAFQAVFLVLARKAAFVKPREALPAWLHGVARRVALESRSARLRRSRRCQSLDALPATGWFWKNPVSGPADPLAEISARELLLMVDQEVRRLPENYRLPVILCCLEGRSVEEASRQLGWTPGSVKGRLERGRARLHQRLLRRGLTLAAVLAAAEVSRTEAAARTGQLVSVTARGAIAFAARPTAAPSGVSATSLVLARNLVKAMALARLKAAAALFLAASLLAAGFALYRATDASSLPSTSAAGRAEDSGRTVAHAVPAEASSSRTDGYGDPLPAGAIARIGTMRFRQGSQIYNLAFSPDGRLIASGSYHGDLCLWDRASGRLVHRLVEPSAAESPPMVTAIAFSPDGTILASNKGDGCLWDVRSGKLLGCLDRSFTRSVYSIYSVAFSPDGKTLAVGTEKGIWLCDPATGRPSRSLRGHPGIVPVAVFSKDGKVLASGSPDRTARLLDVATGEEIRRFEPGDKVVDVALAPDDQLLAVQTMQAVSLWEIATGRQVQRFAAERHSRSLAFSPDGSRLASANLVWDVKTGKEVCRLEGVPGSGLAWTDDKTLVWVTGALGGTVTGALAFAPDGQALITGGHDGVVRWHDPATGKELAQANITAWNRGMMTVCGFGPDSRWLAVLDHGDVHLCETLSGREIHRLALGDDHGASTAFPLPVAVAPNGTTVVAAGAKALYQWDTATGKERRRISRGTEALKPAAAIAFAPDGRTFACAHYEPTIGLWDTATFKEIGRFRGDESGVQQLFFLPDGKRLACASVNRTMQIWDLVTRKEIRRWPLPSGWIEAFSPDGKTVVVGGAGGETRALSLYDLVSGKELGGLGGIKGSSYCAFSADGRLLAVDADPVSYPDRARTLQLLEVASGQVRAQFAGHFGFPEQMIFSPDGKLLASGSSDTTALIWDVTGRLSEGRLRPQRLSAADLQDLWAELAAPDARAAHRAIWTLAAAPSQAVALLKEKLRPIPEGANPQVARLIDDLGSNQFAVREQVGEQLEKLGDRAEPALQKLLAGDCSPEVRRRAEQMLDSLKRSSAVLQKSRAVETLEHIASSEAIQLLIALAQGAPEARVTQEAKASLARLTTSGFKTWGSLPNLPSPQQVWQPAPRFETASKVVGR